MGLVDYCNRGSTSHIQNNMARPCIRETAEYGLQKKGLTQLRNTETKRIVLLKDLEPSCWKSAYIHSGAYGFAISSKQKETGLLRNLLLVSVKEYKENITSS